MKELTYFKFTIQEWQNGHITMLPDSVQGVFINVCAYYWAQEGNVTQEMLDFRFKSKAKTIQKLIKEGLIKQQNGIIMVSFLDEQLSELKQSKKFYSDMGKLGQKVKKEKAPLKPPSSDSLSYKSKEKKNRVEKFKKPSLLEIKDYISEKSYNVNPNDFYSFYESKGWMVGKNKMKSWRAGLSLWNSRNKTESTEPVESPEALRKAHEALDACRVPINYGTGKLGDR